MPVVPHASTDVSRQAPVVTTEPYDLILVYEASRMLAEARTLDEIRVIRSFAAAAQAYAQKARLGLDAQNDAAVISIEATIRLGEVLAEMRLSGERATGYAPLRVDSQVGTPPSTLADLGVTGRESAQAQALAASAGEVRQFIYRSRTGGNPVTLGRAERVARNAAAARKRAARLAATPTLPPTCDLRCGDFMNVLVDLSDGSVDLILTDPPYEAEHLPLWSDLGAFAARVLKPDGMLATMSGHAHLPDVMARLGEHLPYRWAMAYLTPGPAADLHVIRVTTHWKPVLVYGSRARWLHGDVARSDGRDKEHHAWGQSVSGMEDLLRRLADPGQVICDPFAGGGTTAVVALAYGCSFVGSELDESTFDVALRRLAA